MKMLSEKNLEYDPEELSDRRMGQILRDHIDSLGWHIEYFTNSKNRIDIAARMVHWRWIIEVRGMNYQISEPLTSFLSVLGDILQRMDDPQARHSIALPDTIPFRRLWKRLPPLVKQKTGITALFVNPAGFVREDFS